MRIRKLRKKIEHKFLDIRGWKNWKEYDKIRGSTEGDINCRNELIEIAIEETIHNLNQTYSQQIKKDEEVTLTTDNHLETRNDAEEDNKKSVKTVDVDTRSADTPRGYNKAKEGLKKIKKGWGKPYGY